jgi:CRP/FNR family transcriptional regulator
MQVFKSILKLNQPFAEEYLKDFSKDVLTVYNRLIYLTQKQMPGRMADALLYLHDEIFNASTFPMIVSRYDLAGLSAMSRESAAKVLRDFQKDGLVSISENEMSLIEVDTLRKISRIG